MPLARALFCLCAELHSSHLLLSGMLPTMARSSLSDAKATNSRNFYHFLRHVRSRDVLKETMKHEPFRGLEAYGRQLRSRMLPE